MGGDLGWRAVGRHPAIPSLPWLMPLSTNMSSQVQGWQPSYDR